MGCGPTPQLTPITSAPASAQARATSSGVVAVERLAVLGEGHLGHAAAGHSGLAPPRRAARHLVQV